ncbi:MAG: Retron-type reverse transcriptase [Candidatus Moranbacteria bacterium GW2011_GWA2_39_41]|nr:MAG: Retron-type reverse transcriptase [Candidatus Moranbacteria bacterium GW2011_GWA2_39_41]
MKTQLSHTFADIICLENLLEAWKEFVRGKRNKEDVQIFQMRLMDNIFTLHYDLLNHTYKHGGYQAFKINDPKPRDIHKATVRDRLLHHAIYRKLYPFFDKTFIADSYSCRINKGTHKAIKKFKEYANIVSQNNTKTCWILKCDIRKFFANIDHVILLKILAEYIPDKNILKLLENIIESFSTEPSVGLPLGNLTSQLLVNIYMNKFDQFVKHQMKAKYYIRYADDFVFLSESKSELEKQLAIAEKFLATELKLEMHPDKVFIKTLASGVDFLGWINFSDHRVLRTATKKRMIRRIRENSEEATVNSYLGMLGWGNGRKLQREIMRESVQSKF